MFTQPHRNGIRSVRPPLRQHSRYRLLLPALQQPQHIQEILLVLRPKLHFLLEVLGVSLLQIHSQPLRDIIYLRTRHAAPPPSRLRHLLGPLFPDQTLRFLFAHLLQQLPKLLRLHRLGAQKLPYRPVQKPPPNLMIALIHTIRASHAPPAP